MDKGVGGVAVGLATISIVLATVVLAGENASTGPLQFIERYFGFSPDGGDGSMEILAASRCGGPRGFGRYCHPSARTLELMPP